MKHMHDFKHQHYRNKTICKYICDGKFPNLKILHEQKNLNG